MSVVQKTLTEKQLRNVRLVLGVFVSRPVRPARTATETWHKQYQSLVITYFNLKSWCMDYRAGARHQYFYVFADYRAGVL